ncbi:MAG: DUF370 domain-containing protein [Chloroflexi bacterium]|nr:DUF370 domain-containing protein [Chloroflexota bacterium]
MASRDRAAKAAAPLLQVGFGNVVASRRVVAILPGTSGSRGAFSASTGRLIASAKENGQLVDMTNGRRTKAVLVLDTGHVGLAAMSPRTIVARLSGVDEKELLRGGMFAQGVED